MRLKAKYRKVQNNEWLVPHIELLTRGNDKIYDSLIQDKNIRSYIQKTNITSLSELYD